MPYTKTAKPRNIGSKLPFYSFEIGDPVFAGKRFPKKSGFLLASMFSPNWASSKIRTYMIWPNGNSVTSMLVTDVGDQILWI